MMQMRGLVNQVQFLGCEPFQESPLWQRVQLRPHSHHLLLVLLQEHREALRASRGEHGDGGGLRKDSCQSHANSWIVRVQAHQART
eukprot:CAMPEP_0196597742 /NCGR_PEP_ID=MMETSP1081-20130531/92734_1 /TAXON_ID=36882 /ORGANISM="Pyramimonas amylifera, Strain CCMP720" /LENGTH=85 /DNA_ID=CAMNT_0041923251 /DNA_START=35 /DNA_END=288 /DNA_ORIENTATION=+